MKNKLIFILLFLTGFFFFLPAVSHAQSSGGDRITSFRSEIKIDPDSSMTVIETIQVKCEGINIQHGIYRDFPTRYKDEMGNNHNVGFKILWVKRGGKDEPYQIKPYMNGKHVYIGGKDIYLKRGRIYTYKIKYQTTRQIGYFDDHDELYWNVTGNGWGFPIDHVSATVSLPDGITRDNISTGGFTGRMGEKGNSYSAEINDEGKAIFQTTSGLDTGEGFSIVVGFPKGFVTEPSFDDKILYFFQDNFVYIIGIFALIILMIYYIPTWIRFGKDLPKGIIIPLFEPPDDLSPAAVRFIKRMGYDDKTFAACLINMAVKGFVKISETQKTYTITRYVEFDSVKDYKLAPEEEVIARKLLYFDDYFVLSNENYERISKAQEALKNKLERRYENKFFVTNISYLMPGIAISAIALLAIILALISQGGLSWLTDFFAGSLLNCGATVVFIYMTVPQIMRFTQETLSGIKAFVNTVFLLLFGLSIGSFGLAYLMDSSTVLLGLFVAAFVFINIIFYHLMKAPTFEGRKILDQIEGFKMYLATAEKDRLNLLNPPEQTPELFEKYLPYALALEVEQQWSEQFAYSLAEAGLGDIEDYAPGWFTGESFAAAYEGVFVSSMINSMAGAISLSSHPPGSESGFSGGEGSGGGGGGGGGGGW